MTEKENFGFRYKILAHFMGSGQEFTTFMRKHNSKCPKFMVMFGEVKHS